MKRIVLLFSVAALLSACQAPETGAPERDAVIHHNWWNYYERGLARLAAEEPARAREDFERCLELRPGARFGNLQDRLRVRTYGMHVCEGYFPHRELGICLHLEGRSAEAIPHLEESLRTAPSGRARHYLNLAHRVTLAPAAAEAPRIEIAAASRARWTTATTRRLDGVARGSGMVSRITVNGAPLFIELARAEQPFAQDIPLREGDIRVQVTARDLQGREHAETLTWTADWRPPTFTTRQVEQRGAEWRLTGRAEDDQALAGVWLDGRPLAGTGDARSRTIEVTLRAGVPALLVLEDAAGQRRQVRLSTDALAGDTTRDAHPQLAAAGSAALPAGAPADAKRPTLDLAQADGTAHTVYHSRYFLDGVARDRGGLASVTVLGEPSLPADLRGSAERYFSALLDLEPGTNLIWVTAQDLAGNVASQTVTLVREEPQWGREEHRLRAILPPLKNLGDGLQSEKTHAALWGELGRKPRRFRLLERAYGLEALLKEHQLSQSSLARPSAALQAGRLETADLLLVGALVREGARGNTIRVSVIETTQGEELFTEDVYSEDLDAEMDYLAGGLVMKLKQRLPLAQGRVTRLDGQRALLQLGAKDEVVAGSRFLVLRLPEGDTDLAAAVVCRAGERAVELTVTERRAEGAEAKVEPAEARELLRPGDAVYAR